MYDEFHSFSKKSAGVLGSSWAFSAAVAVIVVWAVTGPIFHFSNTWQLIINTGTTIVTFLMVFLIQNSQNRDSKAVHLKLDALLSSRRRPFAGLVELENLTEDDLEQLRKDFKRRHDPQSIRRVEEELDKQLEEKQKVEEEEPAGEARR
ncbi:MAG: low affinity iron permease family protein [Rubrobacter sp.]|nr:low affinity iron permease family protein [Rubrobacter sp.]